MASYTIKRFGDISAEEKVSILSYNSSVVLAAAERYKTETGDESMMPLGGMFFGIFPVIFGLVFVLVIGVFIVTAVRGVAQLNRNNNSPVLTVEARVVAKRTNVSHHHHHQDNGMDHISTSTSYYVTFEFESGDRLELYVPAGEYGYLAEGDMGRLTFQGTRYKGFERFGDQYQP
jgi:hypothetical protein